MDRRTVLASTGITFSAALAGCSELEDDAEEKDGDDLDDQKNDQDDGADDFSEDDDLGGDDSADDQEDQESEDPDQDDEQSDEEEEYEIQEEDEQDQDEEQDEDTEEDDSNDEPEERPDVILPEEAEAHLDVRNHDLESSGDGCEFYVELERTSSEDEYHVFFDTEITLYSDDGETIAEKSGPSMSRDDPGEGESRVYSISFDDCDGADQYTFQVANFGAILSADAMEADVDIHPQLEEKLEIDHEFSWVDEPGSGRCRINISARNVTQDSVISATANSNDIDRGLTNLEPGKSDSKEIEGSCTEDIERYMVQIGTEDYKIDDAEVVNDHNEEIDAEGEVTLSEEAEEHLEVRDHALVWRDADRTEVEVRIELEKTSADKYHFSFRSGTTVYDDDGETITGNPRLGPSGREQLDEGEIRMYSVGIDPEGVEEAAGYRVRISNFNAYVHVDDLEPDFDLDAELEEKLEVTDASIGFGDSDYAPIYDSKRCGKSATVENITEDYRLTVRGPDGEFHTAVELEPGETADFWNTGGQCAPADLTYGFRIYAEEVEEIDDADDA
ncbi:MULTISPECIES: DNA polymerase V family protein [Natrialbaceae]|uniref:DNA polymerase V family protein n=1 Tax=Natrialbaceae TaxID=1644061 RepID=UPI00207C6E74|nr:DNA polymerase V family protein [Natronococcus sp. CG52]